ncbi:hypothetical protein Tco_0370992 [Tanacetum coccineum]
MAALKYRDEHNKVGFLEKPKGSADYHQVLDFLRASKKAPPSYMATIDRTPCTINWNHSRDNLDTQVGHMPLLGTMLHPDQAAIAG